MMKKLVLASAIVLGSLGFVACDSDDNSGEQTPNILEGTWEADELSYTMPDGQSHTWAFDHESIKQGCATDYLTILANNSASLTENNMDDTGNCVDVVIDGTWTEDTVTIEGETEPRTIIEVTETTLTLEYPFSFGQFETDVTVTYNRQ